MEPAKLYSRPPPRWRPAITNAPSSTTEISNRAYPFGKYAHQSQLNLAYAYYRFSMNPNPHSPRPTASSSCIRVTPTAYAYYLRGLVNFNRSPGFSTASADRHLAARSGRHTRFIRDFASDSRSSRTANTPRTPPAACSTCATTWRNERGSRRTLLHASGRVSPPPIAPST